MIFIYTDGDLRPLSFLDFVSAPLSYAQFPVLIFEPLEGSPAQATEPCAMHLSYTDTSRTIHQNFTFKTFQPGKTRLWLLLSTTISQTLSKEVTACASRFPFTEYSCTSAVDPYAVFDDLKPFVSFATAFRPQPTVLRCSSPARGLGQIVPDRISTGKSQQRPPLQIDFTRQTFVPVVRESECDFVTKGLYIGTEGAARNIDLLRSLQISHIVNLNGYEAGGGFPDGFEYRIVKQRDGAWETLTDEFWAALQFTKDAIEKGGSVLVHCRCGIIRSAALCIAYLMDVQGMTVEAALAFLKQQRPAVNPPQGFLDQLKEKAERENAGKRPESGRKRMLPPSVLVALAGKGRGLDPVVPDSH
jgi:hypothetical protein